MKINSYKLGIFHWLFVGMLCLLVCSSAWGQWVQTNGPYGKVSCFAVNGSSLFAGTSDGVYLSTNNGSSWTAVNTGLTYPVWSLAISGSNLFAGTKDNGVYLSTNNGSSWTEVNTGLTYTDVWSLAVNGSNLFAGTYYGGVYLSTNNGSSWTAVNIGLSNTGVRSFAVNGSNLFVGTYDGGVYLSTNDGSSWTAVNTGLSNSYVQSLAVSGSNLFAGTSGGVYLSTNNGSSWTAVNTGLTYTDVWSLAVNGSNLFAGTYYGGVYLSTNNGSSWTAVNIGLSNSYVKSLAVSGTNLFAGTDGGAYLSTNNGSSWTAVNTGLSNMGVLSFAVNGSNLFVGTYYGGVYLSTNNGSFWTAVNKGLWNTDVWSLAISGSNHFAGTGTMLYGGVYLSPNNGSSWTAVNNGLAHQHVGSIVVNGSNLFAGTSGGVYLSTNNGSSWTAVNNGLTNISVSSLAVSGTNLFAATGGRDAYLSTDNGTSWSVIYTGLNTNVRLLLVNGSNLFAGTSNDGMYVTTNNGATWKTANNGITITNMKVSSLIVSGKNLFAGTLGGRVYISTNNGASWLLVSNAMADCGVVALSASGTTLFAGTDYYGVWKTDISSFINRLLSVPLAGNITICQTENTTLHVKTTGGTKPYSYSWSYTDGISIPQSEIFSGGASDSSLLLKPSSTKDYRCIVSDSLFAKDTVIFTITVNQKPIPTITQNGNELQSDLADSYQWLDNTGTPIVGATNRTYTPVTSGTYSVRVTKNGCTGESSGFVFTNSNPPPCITILDADAGEWVYAFTEGKRFSIKIVNKYNQSCTITSLNISNVNFSVVGGQLPIEILADDTVNVEMRYIPNGIGNDSSTIDAVTICNCSSPGKVSGRGINLPSNAIVTTLELVPNKYNVSVGEELTVSLILKNQVPKHTEGTYKWIGQFEYDGRVLYDKNYTLKKGKIPQKAQHLMIGNWEPEALNDTLYHYNFLVKLSDVDSTKLLFKNDSPIEAFEWLKSKDSNIVYVQRLEENVVHVNICKDNGNQYIRFPALDNIKIIAPNPSTGNTNITITMGIEGECRVSLVDIFGRVIQEIHYDKLPKGEYSIKFDDSSVETGTYYVVMRTGYNVSSQKVTVVR